ncbi:uncharacterized protein L3040_008440 [Drepanopeziza brunnea f. sp. 'multigermtubi']|uniref:uncharacterized protein n=1 Tax=Drepanopeziza brunnea f. sp. 'multigermtubi' TaxID=698441 RepID=UPI0023959614|nr:hypothetical protein L3040_008440 [Drepanopeziza brunnea f. sp. 'multigermtubi']
MWRPRFVVTESPANLLGIKGVDDHETNTGAPMSTHNSYRYTRILVLCRNYREEIRHICATGNFGQCVATRTKLSTNDKKRNFVPIQHRRFSER